ncbi:DNA-3-methyladenine glycosylase II [Paramicrobacterium humi]|uniref:DNA-3-methyladenine glycosylase II n=1 Tax=Paramicrobacterium humi TaxID=640635 RepID=A0A1H4J9X7_9MICO|nr:AlkA N-terminal domain-containing protein [Microbacterium humi]SEB43129.1 DNA-3-methyladenine glycosylase II [Microbacterium humi]
MLPSFRHHARLPFTPPYDAAALLAAQRVHAVTGLDEPYEPDAASITRSIRTADGPAVIRARFGDDLVDLDATVPIDDDLTARVRRWLDLDVDPRSVLTALGEDPVLGTLIDRRPGLRILGHLDDFEAASFAVLGQQVSLAAARTFQRRFVVAYGDPVAGTDYRAFPTARAIAALDVLRVREAIGLTRSRAATLHAVAVALADGLAFDGEPGLVRERLLALPGIGPWTADYLAVRAVGDRDAFPVGDLVLRRALGSVSAAHAERLSQPWRPVRAYAAFHLWTAHAYLP